MRAPVDLARVHGALAQLDQLMTDRPELCSARTVDYFAGALLGVEDAVRTIQLGLRVPVPIVDRAEALVPLLEADHRIAALGPVSRAKVLHLAIVRGLEVLEREYGEAS